MRISKPTSAKVALVFVPTSAFTPATRSLPYRCSSKAHVEAHRARRRTLHADAVDRLRWPRAPDAVARTIDLRRVGQAALIRGGGGDTRKLPVRECAPVRDRTTPEAATDSTATRAIDRRPTDAPWSMRQRTRPSKRSRTCIARRTKTMRQRGGSRRVSRSRSPVRSHPARIAQARRARD